jgi:hypothetical protein
VEIPYALRGPLPEGDYLLSITGPQAANDARVHAELLHRASGRADEPLASVDAAAGQGVDGGLPGDLSVPMHAAALAGACGDQLVLRAQVVSASSAYLEFLVTLTLP